MLTDQRVEAIFTEMDELVIELASDPGSLGPQYFQDLIATCRNYLNRVGLVLNELNRDRMSTSSEVRGLEAAFELQHDDILANDQSIKELGSSIEDRKAAVGWRLRAERAALHEARARMQTLNAIHKVVAFRNKELHATMTAIRDQKRLMTAEIRSGSFYGDERTNPSRPGDDDGGGVSAEELAAILSEPLEGAIPTTIGSSDCEPTRDALVSVEGESDVLRFLNERSPRPEPSGTQNHAAALKAEATDDFEDLLKGL